MSFQVQNLVAIELAYINTKHPDFHKEAALVPSLLEAIDDEENAKLPKRTTNRANNVTVEDRDKVINFCIFIYLSVLILPQHLSSMIKLKMQNLLGRWN